MTINYSERIPNNVNLANDRALQRALEHWQPKFLDWWREMGPNDFAGADVYLRTAVGVDAQGWASYGAVKMPDYRWGIFLADPLPDRSIGFGDHFGSRVSMSRRARCSRSSTKALASRVRCSSSCWRRTGVTCCCRRITTARRASRCPR